ncbi:hypothetical protein KEM55_007950 [Ascosphaera atra]|nr:hypothetical protein KEM55_007950 [Ascosphaera atra]
MEAYGFDDPQRKELIARIAEKRPQVSSAAWAMLWTCEVNALSEIARADEYAEKLGLPTFHSLLDIPAAPSCDAVLTAPLLWLQKRTIPHAIVPLKRRRDEEPVDDTLTIHSERSLRANEAKKACRERDSNKCIITRQGLFEVAHIYPIGLCKITSNSGASDDLNIWSALRDFWNKEKLQSRERAIFGDNGTYRDTCRNLLSLSLDAHGYHSRAWFALRPLNVSEDERSMVVEFHWLEKHEYTTTMRLDTTPHLSSTGACQGPLNARLYNHTDNTPYRTGDRITLTTDDPVHHPLPSREILDLQWTLQRLCALSGAADVDDSPPEDDDGEPDADLETSIPEDITEEDPGRTSKSKIEEWVQGVPQGKPP